MSPPPSVSHFPPAPAPRDCKHFTGSVAATPFPTLPASRHLPTMHPPPPQMSLSLGRSVASTPALIAAVNTTYLLQPLVLQTVDLHPVPMFGQVRGTVGGGGPQIGRSPATGVCLVMCKQSYLVLPKAAAGMHPVHPSTHTPPPFWLANPERCYPEHVHSHVAMHCLLLTSYPQLLPPIHLHHRTELATRRTALPISCVSP